MADGDRERTLRPLQPPPEEREEQQPLRDRRTAPAPRPPESTRVVEQRSFGSQPASASGVHRRRADESRDINAGFQVAEGKTSIALGEFGRAVENSMANARAAVPAVAGLVAGSLGYEDTAREFGERVRAELATARHQPRMPEIRKVRSLGDFGDYMAHLAGSQLPVISSIIGANIATRGAAGRVMPSMISLQASRQAALRTATTAKTPAQRATSLRAAQAYARDLDMRSHTVGSFGSIGAIMGVTAPEQATEIMLDENARGSFQQRAGGALLSTAAAGAVGVLPVHRFMKSAGFGQRAHRDAIQANRAAVEAGMKALTGQVPQRNLLQHLRREVPTQAALNAIVEVAQEASLRAAHVAFKEEAGFFDDEALARYFEASVASFIIGGFLGAAGPTIQASTLKMAELGEKANIADRVRERIDAHQRKRIRDNVLQDRDKVTNNGVMRRVRALDDEFGTEGTLSPESMDSFADLVGAENAETFLTEAAREGRPLSDYLADLVLNDQGRGPTKVFASKITGRPFEERVEEVGDYAVGEGIVRQYGPPELHQSLAQMDKARRGDTFVLIGQLTSALSHAETATAETVTQFRQALSELIGDPVVEEAIEFAQRKRLAFEEANARLEVDGETFRTPGEQIDRLMNEGLSREDIELGFKYTDRLTLDSVQGEMDALGRPMLGIDEARGAAKPQALELGDQGGRIVPFAKPREGQESRARQRAEETWANYPHEVRDLGDVLADRLGPEGLLAQANEMVARLREAGVKHAPKGAFRSPERARDYLNRHYEVAEMTEDGMIRDAEIRAEGGFGVDQLQQILRPPDASVLPRDDQVTMIGPRGERVMVDLVSAARQFAQNRINRHIGAAHRETGPHAMAANAIAQLMEQGYRLPTREETQAALRQAEKNLAGTKRDSAVHKRQQKRIEDFRQREQDEGLTHQTIVQRIRKLPKFNLSDLFQMRTRRRLEDEKGLGSREIEFMAYSMNREAKNLRARGESESMAVRGLEIAAQALEMTLEGSQDSLDAATAIYETLNARERSAADAFVDKIVRDFTSTADEAAVRLGDLLMGKDLFRARQRLKAQERTAELAAARERMQKTSRMAAKRYVANLLRDGDLPSFRRRALGDVVRLFGKLDAADKGSNKAQARKRVNEWYRTLAPQRRLGIDREMLAVRAELATQELRKALDSTLPSWVKEGMRTELKVLDDLRTVSQARVRQPHLTPDELSKRASGEYAAKLFEALRKLKTQEGKLESLKGLDNVDGPRHASVTKNLTLFDFAEFAANEASFETMASRFESIEFTADEIESFARRLEAFLRMRDQYVALQAAVTGPSVEDMITAIDLRLGRKPKATTEQLVRLVVDKKEMKLPREFVRMYALKAIQGQRFGAELKDDDGNVIISAQRMAMLDINEHFDQTLRSEEFQRQLANYVEAFADISYEQALTRIVEVQRGFEGSSSARTRRPPRKKTKKKKPLTKKQIKKAEEDARFGRRPAQGVRQASLPVEGAPPVKRDLFYNILDHGDTLPRDGFRHIIPPKIFRSGGPGGVIKFKGKTPFWKDPELLSMLEEMNVYGEHFFGDPSPTLLSNSQVGEFARLSIFEEYLTPKDIREAHRETRKEVKRAKASDDSIDRLFADIDNPGQNLLFERAAKNAGKPLQELLDEHYAKGREQMRRSWDAALEDSKARTPERKLSAKERMKERARKVERRKEMVELVNQTAGLTDQQIEQHAAFIADVEAHSSMSEAGSMGELREMSVGEMDEMFIEIYKQEKPKAVQELTDLRARAQKIADAPVKSESVARYSSMDAEFAVRTLESEVRYVLVMSPEVFRSAGPTFTVEGARVITSAQMMGFSRDIKAIAEQFEGRLTKPLKSEAEQDLLEKMAFRTLDQFWDLADANFEVREVLDGAFMANPRHDSVPAQAMMMLHSVLTQLALAQRPDRMEAADPGSAARASMPAARKERLTQMFDKMLEKTGIKIRIVSNSQEFLDAALPGKTKAEQENIRETNTNVFESDDSLFGGFISAAGAHGDAFGGFKHGALKDAEGRVIMYLSPFMRTHTQVFGALHEMGHVIDFEVLSRESPEVRAAIEGEYKKWINSLSDDDTLTLYDVLLSKQGVYAKAFGPMERQGARMSPRELRDMFSNADDMFYHLGFDEWFADNVAKTLLGSSQAQGVIAQFFNKVVQMYKDIIALFKGDDQTMKSPVLEKWLHQVLFGDRLETHRIMANQRAMGWYKNTKLLGRLAVAEAVLGKENVVELRTDAEAKVKEMVGEFYRDGKGPPSINASLLGAAATIQASRSARIDGQDGSLERNWTLREVINVQMTADERRTLAQVFNSFKVRQQITDFIEDDIAWLMEVEGNQDALIATGYQMWEAGMLKLAPRGAGLFASLDKFMHETVIGELQRHDQAEQIMIALLDGAISSRRTYFESAAHSNSNIGKGLYGLSHAQLMQLRPLLGRVPPDATRQEIYDELKDIRSFDYNHMDRKTRELLAADIQHEYLHRGIVNAALEMPSWAINPHETFVVQKQISDNTLNSVGRGMRTAYTVFGNMLSGLFFGQMQKARWSDNQGWVDGANLLYRDPAGGRMGTSYDQAKTMAVGRFMEQYTDIFQPLNEEQKVQVMEAVQEGRHLRVKDGFDPLTVKAQKNYIKLTSDIYDHLTGTGLKVGNLGTEARRIYFPWVFDERAFLERGKDFMSLATQMKYKKHWAALYKEKKGEAPADNKALIEFTRAYVRALANQDGFADSEVIVDPGKTKPHVRSVFHRELDFLWRDGNEGDRKKLASFMSKDMNRVMATYINQAMKRATFEEFFGRGQLEAIEGHIIAQGGDAAAVQAFRDSVAMQMGVYGLEISPAQQHVINFFAKVLGKDPQALDAETLRRWHGYIVTYQNIRTLAFAAMTNVVDMMGLAVRSGSFGIAYEGMREGFKAVRSEAKNPKDRAALLRQAEMLGVAEKIVVQDAIGQLYGGVHLTGPMAKVNDLFFKYNGMMALNRFLRISALGTAKLFIAKHIDGANAGDKFSVQMLKDLGLRTEDIVMEDGEIKLLTDHEVHARSRGFTAEIIAREHIMSETQFETLKGQGTPEAIARQLDFREVLRDHRVKNALFRFVDEAVMRPSAMQRPGWGNDPNWAVFFHLKAFMYTYHERHLRRALHHLGARGEVGPLLMMASFPAMMIGVDLLREILQHGPNGDPRKRDWGPLDYGADGIHRSGVLGMHNYIPDMRKTAQLGRNPLIEIGGPAVSQIDGLSRAMVGSRSKRRAALDALPANNVWRAFDNWGKHFDDANIPPLPQAPLLTPRVKLRGLGTRDAQIKRAAADLDPRTQRELYAVALVGPKRYADEARRLLAAQQEHYGSDVDNQASQMSRAQAQALASRSQFLPRAERAKIEQELRR